MRRKRGISKFNLWEDIKRFFKNGYTEEDLLAYIKVKFHIKEKDCCIQRRLFGYYDGDNALQRYEVSLLMFIIQRADEFLKGSSKYKKNLEEKILEKRIITNNKEVEKIIDKVFREINRKIRDLEEKYIEEKATIEKKLDKTNKCTKQLDNIVRQKYEIFMKERILEWNNVFELDYILSDDFKKPKIPKKYLKKFEEIRKKYIEEIQNYNGFKSEAEKDILISKIKEIEEE